MKVKTKLSLLAMTCSAMLVACGGGSDAGDTGSAQMENSVSPDGIVEVPAGGLITVTSNVAALQSSISSQKWTIEQQTGLPPSASDLPKLTDADCANASKVPGSAAGSQSIGGITGKASCTTTLLVPASAPVGDWIVKNVAESESGYTAYDTFTLRVVQSAASKDGFTAVVPSAAIAQEVNKQASITASYKANPGVAVENVTYLWKQTKGATLTVVGADQPTLTFTPSAVGEYAFDVVVTAKVDGVVKASKAAVVVKVEAVPTPFSVSAGDIQVVDMNTPVTLSATVTGGDQGNVYSYEWSQISGPKTVTIANSKTATASFVSDVSGEYQFQVTAATTKLSASATTIVNIKPPLVPFFSVSAGPAQSVTVNTIVSLKGTMTAGTPAPKNVSYQWTQTSGPTTLSISNNTSLEASVIPTVVGTYTFSLTGTDDTGISKSSSVTVLVNPVPPAPTTP